MDAGRLGATADQGIEGANQDVVRRGDRIGDFAYNDVFDATTEHLFHGALTGRISVEALRTLVLSSGWRSFRSQFSSTKRNQRELGADPRPTAFPNSFRTGPLRIHPSSSSNDL